MRKYNFPNNFFWGASTASYQVEGDNSTQWSKWEKQNAAKLARTAEKRLGYMKKWPEIKLQAENPENYLSGKGVDHYKRYEEDFDIAKKLNLNAFRFGIEWARLEPKEGQWDETEIAHYQKYIKAMRQQGLEPFLNLWHWTMPTWFTEKGGFEKKDNLIHFENFVKKVAETLIDDVNYILTINEPNTYTILSYVAGEWTPQKRNLITAYKVYRNLAKAHNLSYRIIKQHKPSIQIGPATQINNVQAKHPQNPISRLATKSYRYLWNWWYVNMIRQNIDFVGFNYYFTDYMTGFFTHHNPKSPINDLNWYMEPEGLYPALLQTWARYKKPIFVTENGVADSHDDYRQWWIEQTIIAMERAMSAGVDLRGYMHWSLLDNFEWKYGWWPKFGLIEVDRKTMKRTIRPSAKWFASQIKLMRD